MSGKKPVNREILQKIATGQMTIDEGMAALKEPRQTHFKVTPKGAVGFYGLRRMPITLYVQELQEILRVAQTEDFLAFLENNRETLSRK